MIKNLIKKFGKKECILLFVFLILITLSIIYDFFKFKTYFIVDNEYIYSIFGTIGTISLISISLLNILVGSTNFLYLGFNLNDIVLLRSNDYYFSNVIYIAFSFLFFSFLALVLNYINVISTLFVILLYYIIIITHYLWKLLFDKEFLNLLIVEEIENLNSDSKKNEVKNIHNILWKYFLNDFSVNGINYNQQTIALIYINMMNTNNINISTILFDMYKDLSIYQSKFGHYLVNEVYFNLFYRNIKKNKNIIIEIENNIIRNVEENLRNNIEQNVSSITNYFDFPKFSFKLKSLILFSTIKRIYFSYNLNMSLKRENYLELFNSYFRQIVDSAEINVECINVILNIFKILVLTSSDHENSKEIFISLFSTIKKMIWTSTNDSIELLFGLLLYSNYIYSFLENDTISFDQSSFLSNLINLSFSPIANEKYKIVSFIREELESIILSLSKSKIIDNYFSTLDYFPDWIEVKTKTIGNESWLSFQFSLYLITDAYIDFKFLLSNLKSNDDTLYKNIIRVLIDKFDGLDLNESFKKETLNIANWLGIDPIHISEKVSKSFSILNEKQVKEFNDGLDKTDLDIDFQIIENGIKERIHNYIRRFQPLDVNSLKNKIVNSIVYITNPFDKDIDLIHYFSKKVNRYIHKYIDTNTKKVLIDLEVNNIDEIISILNNYSGYSKDYLITLPQIIINNDKFRMIEQKIQDFEQINEGYFRRMFFNKEDLSMIITDVNLKVSKLGLIEIENLLKQFHVNDGLYKIEGAFLDLDQAKEYIENVYRKIELSYVFNTNYSLNSGCILYYRYFES